jgi:hypothetical protein
MRATVRLDEDLASHVESVRQDDETSDAEAVRECVRRSQRLDDLEGELVEVRQELDRARRERRQLLAEREEKKELARYVEDERTRAQEREQAPVWRRARWWLLGKGEA